eukprot:2814400-Prorocentrum_lima.AAC.1
MSVHAESEPRVSTTAARLHPVQPQGSQSVPDLPDIGPPPSWDVTGTPPPGISHGKCYTSTSNDINSRVMRE